MKNENNFSCIICIFSGGVFAQTLRTSGELNVVTKNNTGDLVTVSMQLDGSACWFATGDDSDLHEPTSAYPGTTQETISDGQDLAWEACWAEDVPGSLPFTFGLGKYKITAKINGVIKDYFWIDWRNDQLEEHFGDVLGNSGDINVWIDVATEKFYWDDDLTKPINHADKKWGEVRGWPTTTSKLIPYKPINFNVFEHFSSPVLVWNHSSQNDFVTNYEIYRAVGMTGNFHRIAQVGSSTTNYVDYDYSVSGHIKLQYKVRAKNGTVVSEFTPTKTIYGGLYKENPDGKSYTFDLAQNYPNPFNPVTTISYSIPGKEFVSLKVYDTIGKEVAQLVNERKSAGKYSVSFNAKNLSSGLYIYKLEVGNYQTIKKLILLK